MQITLPNDLKEWCYYDVSKFKYVLKENAPKHIQKKFKKHEEKSLKMYK